MVLSRSALLRTALAALPAFSPLLPANAVEETKWQRVSPIQFIAALGDPTASSGSGVRHRSTRQFPFLLWLSRAPNPHA